MCVCVCVTVSVYVVCCVRVEKHSKPRETERNVCGMVCVVWCCEVRKCENARNNGKIVKTWSSFLARYGHSWTRKKSKIGHFSQRIVLHISPGIGRRFRPKVLSQTPKKALFGQRSYSKGPNHALEKVLTNETPCICIHPSPLGSRLSFFHIPFENSPLQSGHSVCAEGVLPFPCSPFGLSLCFC